MTRLIQWIVIINESQTIVDNISYCRYYLRHGYFIGAYIQMEPLKQKPLPTVEDPLIKVLLEYPFRAVGKLDNFVRGQQKRIIEEPTNVETK